MATRPSTSSTPPVPAPPRPPLTSAELRAKYARVVAVPKPPKSAYDPDRPISGLLENQVRLLQAAEWKLRPAHRSRVAAQTIATEREASAYIQHVTAKLHPQGAPVASPKRATRRAGAKAKPARRAAAKGRQVPSRRRK